MDLFLPFEILQRDSRGDHVEKFIESASMPFVIEEFFFASLETDAVDSALVNRLTPTWPRF